MKFCPKCNSYKYLFEFGKDITTKDRLKVHCKSCRNEAYRQFNKSNKLKVSQRHKKYFSENKNLVKENRIRNRDHIKNYQEQYYVRNNL